MLDGLRLNTKVFKESPMVFSWHPVPCSSSRTALSQEMCLLSAEYNFWLNSPKKVRDLGRSTGALSRRGVKITFPFPIWLPYKVDLLPTDTDLVFQLPISPQGVSYETRQSVTAQMKLPGRFRPLVKRWLKQSTSPSPMLRNSLRSQRMWKHTKSFFPFGQSWIF